jgi:uncharacterized membrane protein
MNRLVHAVLVGLLGAGIIHIVVLLLVPSYSTRDAWSALAERANYYRLVRLDTQSGNAQPLIDSIDPLFQATACRFDLAEGVVRVVGSGKAPYWSISVYDRGGQNVFSLNDRSSSTGEPDFVIATAVQMVDLRNALPPEFGRSVFIEADIDEGIVVVRAFAPDDSWRARVSDFLQGFTCTSH